jgi:hypothetical protein
MAILPITRTILLLSLTTPFGFRKKLSWFENRSRLIPKPRMQIAAVLMGPLET